MQIGPLGLIMTWKGGVVGEFMDTGFPSWDSDDLVWENIAPVRQKGEITERAIGALDPGKAADHGGDGLSQPPERHRSRER